VYVGKEAEVADALRDSIQDEIAGQIANEHFLRLTGTRGALG
tara:strand:+ start:1395 stop:1520 length:126 start_codon:yes stop_codon:yes gene_type:complete